MLHKNKKQPKLEEVEASERELAKKEVKREQPKDPTRWIALVFFVIFLMISLIFWNQH